MRARAPKSVDLILLALIVILVVIGFFIFSSASLGLLARDGASFGTVAFNQFFFGILGGGIALLITSNVYYRNWRQYAFYIFLAGIFLTLLVFTPLGMTHAGATRWLDLGITTIQPSEFLKIAFVIYIASLLSGTHRQIESWQYGLLPFVGTLGVVGVVMLALPDTDTFMIMAGAGIAMFVTAGAKWRHVLLIFATAVALLIIVAFTRPYVMDRITTFLNPLESDRLGSGYQIDQSLIAVGSGGMLGRGYGQSIQKFEYLPEPIGDSIFAVYAEEFGFIGSFVLICLLAFFTFRGFKIATQAEDVFGMLLVVGFMTLIVSQAFLNIAAMVGIAPLSGLPLPFISHGGTALVAILASLGIVLNVSKYRMLDKRT